MSKLTCFTLIGFLIVMSGCGGVKSRVKGGEIGRSMDEQGITDDYIQAVGIGAADETLENKTQRMATSRQAAVVEGQYQILSIVKGIQLEGGITVEKAMQTDSKLTTSIDEAIKGAELLKTEWTEDDGCVVTMRLDKKKLKKISKLNFR
ncbi:MAG: hypothetical protein ABII23_09590 [bacterium]